MSSRQTKNKKKNTKPLLTLPLPARFYKPHEPQAGSARVRLPAELGIALASAVRVKLGFGDGDGDDVDVDEGGGALSAFLPCEGSRNEIPSFIDLFVALDAY